MLLHYHIWDNTITYICFFMCITPRFSRYIVGATVYGKIWYVNVHVNVHVNVDAPRHVSTDGTGCMVRFVCFVRCGTFCTDGTGCMVRAVRYCTVWYVLYGLHGWYVLYGWMNKILYPIIVWFVVGCCWSDDIPSIGGRYIGAEMPRDVDKITSRCSSCRIVM